LSQSVITRKGQITIPKVIREHLKAKEGEKVAFIMRGDDVVLKVLHGNILDLKGTVKPSRRPEDFEKVRRSVKKAVSSKASRRD
jgi:AbrB family looped-hinge helix DNA binding protein